MLADIATVFGRLFVSAIFILSGISKIGNYGETVQHMQAVGVPGAPFFLYAAVLLELGCGVMVLTGFRARPAALGLFLFMVPTTYLFHFKPAFDASMNVIDKMQLMQATKNLSIMGGLLMIFGNGAGRFKIGNDS